MSLWLVAMRFYQWRTRRPGKQAENIWSYILPLIGVGFFVGAGIGLYQFGGNAVEIQDRYATTDQDGTAFLTGGAWGALGSVPVALAIAALVRVRARTLQRAAKRRALAEVLARQEEQRRGLADKAVRELDTIFARKPYLALDHVQVQQFLRGHKN